MSANKRILSVILVLLLCLSSVIAVSAEDFNYSDHLINDSMVETIGDRADEISNNDIKYKDKIISKLRWENVAESTEYICILEYNADGTEIKPGDTADYALIFAHNGSVLCWEVYEHFGNYMLDRPAVFNPGYIIYSIGEDEIYSIRQAYNQGLPGMELVLKTIGNKVYLYGDVFEEYLEPYCDEKWKDSVEGWYIYEELYYYDKETGGTVEIPEATPDYVLVNTSTYNVDPMYFYEIFGEYLVQIRGCGEPYCGRYHIYTPEDDRIYTLREAYDVGIEGIMNVFTDYGLGCLSGDADEDRKLTIKDATYIQKYLAKIEGFEIKQILGHNIPGETIEIIVYVEDFDSDNQVNIKDATAIQKKLANFSFNK